MTPLSYEPRICPSCNKEKTMWKDDKKCWNCREKDKIGTLSEEVVSTGYSWCEDYIICPYCGDNYGEEEMYDTTNVTCNECNKEFHIEVEHSVSYSTSKIKNREKKT